MGSPGQTDPEMEPEALSRGDRPGRAAGRECSDGHFGDPALEHGRGSQSATGGASAAAAGPRQHAFLQRERRHDGQQHGQLAALALDVLAELATSRALAQVAAQIATP
jgi:hypothetical protein